MRKPSVGGRVCSCRCPQPVLTAAEWTGRSQLRFLNVSEEGRHEFDFIFGRWRAHNRRLADLTDPSCEEWVEFEASSEACPVLDGFGHVDRMYVDDAFGAGSFEGFTLRLFDPKSGTWKIWWSSTRAPGVLAPPVEGRFRERHGIFECEDEVGGRPVVVGLPCRRRRRR